MFLKNNIKQWWPMVAKKLRAETVETVSYCKGR